MCAAHAPHDVALPALRNYSMIELQGNLPVWNSDRPAVAQCLAQRQLNRGGGGQHRPGESSGMRRSEDSGFNSVGRHTKAVPIRIGMTVDLR